MNIESMLIYLYYSLPVAQKAELKNISTSPASRPRALCC